MQSPPLVPVLSLLSMLLSGAVVPVSPEMLMISTFWKMREVPSGKIVSIFATKTGGADDYLFDSGSATDSNGFARVSF